ncbi:hypothetical protein RI129_008679 [Pyrocoelia pectoralis]|uniref:Uncharacterized protein n=1 Tax=Pyrocoelia pectoralis TaxID=417401 RepID=A0AAN7ZG83_9COLE
MLFLLEDINLKLYGSPFPTAAVITGHATGSGCLFCLCCDYRVMVKNFLIGLNELRLGITFPNWIINIMSNTIGFREAELALLAGRLFKTDEALKVGLVDEDASDRDVALKKANAFFEKLETTPSLARIHTTSILRNRVLEDMQRNMNIHVESALFEMLHPTVQTQIELHLCNLKKKKD